MNLSDLTPWGADWAWGLPLVVLTVLIHVCGLAFINEGVVHVVSGAAGRRSSMPRFARIMCVTTLLATLLHATEGAIWGTAYRLLGAMPDKRSAVLYSLGAMTSYGHADLFLKPEWQLMGALEALNGMLLFGLTTAFLFSIIQSAWPLGRQREHRRDAVA
jgi:hypothetical protein